MRKADIVSYASLTAGVFSFVAVLQGNLTHAALLLILAVILDVLDGRVAQLFNENSSFGEYIDSLVDIVVFGMIPVAIAFSLFGSNIFLVLVSIVYLIAGCFRLARFMYEEKKSFIGMPITVNGIGIALLLFFNSRIELFIGYFVLSSILMVSRFKVKKP